MATVEFITRIVQTCVGIAAVVVAIVGLSTWRRQLQGTADDNAARQLLRRLFELRDEIALARHRATVVIRASASTKSSESSLPSESAGPEAVSRGGWTPDFEQMAYEQAWGEVARRRSSLAIELIEAEVLWGIRAAEISKPLDDCLSELRRAIGGNVRAAYYPSHRIESEDVVKARDAILYEENTPESHSFTERINIAVASVENVARRYLRRR